MDRVIVYRNPMEAALWENGISSEGLVIFFWIAVAGGLFAFWIQWIDNNIKARFIRDHQMLTAVILAIPSTVAVKIIFAYLQIADRIGSALMWFAN